MNAKAKALGKKITGKVGSLLASPKTTYFGIKKANADSDTKVLKQARQTKGAPKFDIGRGPTEAHKLQTMAEVIKKKYGK